MSRASDAPLRIALVAGEASGDILGADLIRHLRQHFPNARFEGIAGPLMQAEGAQSRYPMERLSVMGIWPILKRLPELLRARRQLAEHWLAQKPDLFIGIDAPEFNLGLEQRLRAGGIKTVHYVSPSVWAWREKRMFKIRRAVDLMLALFPFELPIYAAHGVPAVHVGHPLADQLPMQPDCDGARTTLALGAADRVLAVLPGSRGSEVALLAPVFLAALTRLFAEDATLRAVIPCANPARRRQLEALLMGWPERHRVQLVDGQARTVMTAADAVLLASGTATLEAMLVKRPMVVAYRVGPVSYFIFKRLLRIKQFSLPNLLCGEAVVPELMQDDCTPEQLADAVRAQLALSEADRQRLTARFSEQHERLRCQAGARAAQAIRTLLS